MRHMGAQPFPTKQNEALNEGALLFSIFCTSGIAINFFFFSWFLAIITRNFSYGNDNWKSYCYSFSKHQIVLTHPRLFVLSCG